MKNIFFSSVLFWSFNINQIIDVAKVEKFTGVEFRAEHIWLNNIKTNDIKRHLERNNIIPLIHAPSWDVNICSFNKEIREQSIVLIKKSIDLSEEIGSKEITIHPGTYNLSEESYETHLVWITENLKEICDYAEGKKQIISIELMENASKQLLTTTDRLNYLLSKLPKSVKVTLDIAHFDNESQFNYALNNLSQISKAHVSNRTKSTYHVPLNEGYLDCSYMIKKLIQLNIPLVIEGLDITSSFELLNKNKNFIKDSKEAI